MPKQPIKTSMTSRRVLICDDDAHLRSVASRWLLDDGWEVVGSIEHAVAAVAMAQALHPDVVLLDISLVGLSGLDVIPELVAAGAAVVVCTSFASSHEAAMRAGASAIVDKADLSSLLDVVNGVASTTPRA
jgi:CheY-like chemotaxis protein